MLTIYLIGVLLSAIFTAWAIWLDGILDVEDVLCGVIIIALSWVGTLLFFCLWVKLERCTVLWKKKEKEDD